jgi:alkylation response protein AidB-like acyl-CoA dehydrogenase
MTTITTATDLLTDEMLARFDSRAAIYDRENRFFDEDWDELRQSGYLLAAVPTEFGGSGLPRSGDRCCREHAPLLDRARRRLAARR